MKRFLPLFIIFLSLVSIKSLAQTGAALDFDGTNDYVSLSSGSYTSYTLEAWVKLAGSVASKNIMVYTDASGPTSNYSHQINTNSSGQFVHYLFDGSGKSVTGTTVATLGTWYHIAVVAQNSGNIRLYVNGVEEGTAVGIGTMWTGGDRFYLGSNATGLGYFQGQMDEVRIWNTARTQTQIQSTMNCEIATSYSGLIANYHFNQGTASGSNGTETSLTDVSGNGYTGTLTNFALTGATSNWVAPGGVTSGYTFQEITFGALASKTYGDADFALTATASSGLTISYTSSDPTVASVSGSTVTILKAGTTTITASQAGNATYAPASDVTQLLTINTKPLTITATNENKTYGTALTGGAGSTTFTSIGLVGTETIGSVTIAYGAGSAATDAVGTYTGSVTPSTATGGTFTANNYSITYTNGNIIVGTKALTVTANDVNKTYGSTITGASGSTAFTSIGLVGAETIGSVTIAYGAGSAATDAVGTYGASVTPSAATGGTFTASNYAITYATADIIVGAKALTVDANNVSKEYGNTLTGSSGITAFTAVGLANGETIGSVTCAYGSGASATDAAGTYIGSITPSVATGGTFTASNYTISYTTGNIIVTKAVLTVTSDNQTRVYGAANPAFTNTITGFKNGETSAVLSSQPVASCSATTTSTVGTYVINPSGAAASNYIFTYVNGLLTVTKAVLTVTADDKTKVYNTANPAFTNTITGYVNGEDASAITTLPTSTSAATTTSNVGTYAITSSGGVATNYSFTYINGTLTIIKADQTITFNAVPTYTYGDPDFTLTATSTSGLTVTFTSSDLSVVTVSGTTAHIVGGGNYILTADQAGNMNYNAAPSVMQSLTIAKLAQTITFGSLSNHWITDPPFTLAATASSGLTPTYTILAGTTMASVSGSTVTLSGTVAGTVTVRANQAGNSNYLAAPPAYQTFVIHQLVNTLTFNAIPNHLVTDAPFNLTATSTYGTVTFSGSDSTIATVSSTGLVTPLKAGTIIVTAYQAGSLTYASAIQKQSLTITKVANTITFPAIPNKYVTAANFTVTATATNGPVTFSGSNNAIATVSSAGVIDPIAAGTITVTATQAGSSTYASATLSRTFTVVKLPNVITFAAIPGKFFNDPAFTVTATAPGGIVTFSGSNAAVATVSSAGLITPVSAGTIIVTARQAGSAIYLASSKTQTFTVKKLANTITFAAIPNAYVDAAAFNLTATATNGPVTFTGSNSLIATVSSSGLVTPIKAGTITITAKQAGSSTYSSASASRTFTVVKHANPISFTAVPSKLATDAPFNMTASAPGGTVTFSGSRSSIATVSSTGLITPVGGGTLTVTMRQAGTALYLASYTTTTIVISKAAQTITWTAIPNKTVGDPDFSISATASSGLTVTYSRISGPATVTGTNVHLTPGTAGVVVLRATQAGSAKYLSKTQDISFTVASAARNSSSNSLNLMKGLLEVNLYPNPSKGTILLESDQSISKIKVFDLTGKCLVSKEFFEENNSVSIDLSDLPKGLYTIQTLSGNEFIDKRVILE